MDDAQTMITMVFFVVMEVILFGVMIVFYLEAKRLRRNQSYYDLNIRLLRTKAQQLENIHLQKEMSNYIDVDKHQGNGVYNSNMQSFESATSLHDKNGHNGQDANTEIPRKKTNSQSTRQRYNFRRSSHDDNCHITRSLIMSKTASPASMMSDTIGYSILNHASPSIKTEQETTVQVPVNSTASFIKAKRNPMSRVPLSEKTALGKAALEILTTSDSEMTESQRLVFECPKSQRCIPNDDSTSQDPRSQDLKSQDPKSQDPKSQDPKSQDPKSQDPKSQDPKSQDPKSQDSKSQDPNSEDPNSEDPIPEDPIPEDPKTENLNSDDPNSEGPKSQESTLQESTSQKSTSQESSSQESTSQESTSQDPTSQEPTSQEPTSQEPTSQEPTSQEPTSQVSMSQEPTFQDSRCPDQETTKTAIKTITTTKETLSPATTKSVVIATTTPATTTVDTTPTTASIQSVKTVMT